MKTITTLLLALFITANLATAQDTLYIYKAGAVIYKQAVSGVDSITFYKANFPTNGLLAWYPFNGNANDESGNGKNGTVNGATLTTDRLGNTNSAYSFNGTTDYILTNCYGPTEKSGRTVSFWAQVKNSIYDVNSIFYYGENTSGKFFSVYFLSSSGTFRADVGGATKDYKSTSIYDTWHFYTVIFPANITFVQNALMYMDGKLLSDFTYLNQNTYSVNTGNTIILPNIRTIS